MPRPIMSDSGRSPLTTRVARDDTLRDPSVEATVCDDQLARQATEIQVPDQIGRYRIVRILGRGAFGVVYLGYDEHLTRPVAVKVPHAERISSPADAARYLEEARLVAGLSHPNIVP